MRFFLISAGVFALAMPVLALAANYVPLAPIPNLDGGEGATLESYINSLFLLVISVGAMLAVIRVVIGGFQYMTQTASTTATSNARQTIRDAVIGLILLLSVYLILSVVNPQILNLSALKFENLAPSDEVKQQIQENREDAERREALLKEWKGVLDTSGSKIESPTRGEGLEWKIDVTGLPISTTRQIIKTGESTVGASGRCFIQVASKDSKFAGRTFVVCEDFKN